MEPYGQDWASYQPEQPPTAGLGFVFVKATEGTAYVNPRHAAQVAHGRAAGLVVGHYHFVRPGSMSAQVSYFLQHAGAQPGDVLALDWEDGGVSGADKDAFLKGLLAAAPHNRVILYCNRDFWINRDSTSYAAEGLWIADPDSPAGQPNVKHPWLLHQYGEHNGTDQDVANFADTGALRAWAAKGTPPPPPKPPAKPAVSLKNVIAAARTDPHAAQGHTTHPADVRLVEAALKAEGLLAAQYAADGSFGSKTIAAYAAWQRRLGYSGTAADGIPGKTSLTKLGARHGFTVAA